MLFGRLAIGIIVLLLSVCALIRQPSSQPAEPEALQCLNRYTAVDQAVAQYGVAPFIPRRVSGIFPICV